jgi:hypothetical protein
MTWWLSIAQLSHGWLVHSWYELIAEHPEGSTMFQISTAYKTILSGPILITEYAFSYTDTLQLAA